MTYRILGIDPGPCESAWVLYEDSKVIAHGLEDNSCVLLRLSAAPFAPAFGTNLWPVVEVVKNYGQIVGDSVLHTAIWIGRFVQKWEDSGLHARSFELVPRKTYISYLCGSSKANDSGVRQAVIDKLGPPWIPPKGKGRKPGPTHGLANDEWQACGLCLGYEEILQERERKAPRNND